jgi:beta-mannanase
MKKVLIHLLVIAFFSPVMISCKKKVACSTDWAIELQDELAAVSDALTAYYMDPTDANCNALKAAYQDYIDAMRPYGNCETLTGQDREDWQAALDEAEASIDTIC